MSVILSYSVPGRHLDQLHGELDRAAALLTPPDDADNTPEAVYGDDPDITLVMPDAVDEPSIDAIVAAHVPQAIYDPATQLARIASVREIARLKADYDTVLQMGRALTTFDDAIDCLEFLIETLIRRDRAAGLY